MISQILPSNRYLMQERKLSEESILAWHLGYVDHSGEAYVDPHFSSNEIWYYVPDNGSL